MGLTVLEKISTSQWTLHFENAVKHTTSNANVIWQKYTNTYTGLFKKPASAMEKNNNNNKKKQYRL